MTTADNHSKVASPSATCSFSLCFNKFHILFFFIANITFYPPVFIFIILGKIVWVSAMPNCCYIKLCASIFMFYEFYCVSFVLHHHHVLRWCSSDFKIILVSCFQIFLDANTIRLGNIPLGSAVDPLEGAPAGTTYTKQTVYELCACANGKLYLSPAEKGSTCQTTSNFCLWSWK